MAANEDMESFERSADWISALRKTRDDLVSMLRDTERAFFSHNAEAARAALQVLDDVNERCDKLTQRVVDRVKKAGEKTDSGVRRVRIVSNIGQLARGIAGLGDIVLEKIENRVLFSDKANHEVKSLLALVRKSIGDVFDGIETGNQTLLIAVIASSEKIAAEANAAATEHEERLVRGVCQPKSSAVFLDLIYSLRGISHALKMLVKDVPEKEG
jgi:Na+/phosphate symporter